MSEPAYTRLPVDERRRQLLERGAELFARHSFDELSMAHIAGEVGTSKALLYHYFPTKQAYFAATLEQAALELAALTEPDPDLPPFEALEASLDAFLGWVDAHALAYTKLLESAGSVSEVKDLIDGVRDRTAQRIAEGVDAGSTPPARAAVRGWLWFMDGVILDWLEHRDMTQDEVRGLLLRALAGALTGL